jgi:hypothetical protein
MKLSKTATQLDIYLLNQNLHPTTFESHSALAADVDRVSRFINPRLDVASPFITACHVMNNRNLINAGGAVLDSKHLVSACRDILHILPIDEVSSQSIRVYSDLLSSESMQIDYSPAISVIANIYMRADQLVPAEAELMKEACIDAFSQCREAGIVTNEVEQFIDKRLARNVALDLVKNLGFNQDNIQSVRNLKSKGASPFAQLMQG